MAAELMINQGDHENVPSEFWILANVEWYLRNEPQRAIAELEDLKQYLGSS